MDLAGNSPPDGNSARDESFPKSARLHSPIEFDQLFARGKVLADSVLVIHARRASSRGRLGISISKRVGHAPLRNRWKRLIREAYRRSLGCTPALARLDILVRPRRGASPDFAAVQRSLTSLSMRMDKALGRS